MKWIIENYEVLTWLVPSALLIIGGLVQWLWGWRRLTDKLKDALDHKVDREEFIEVVGNKLEEEAFHEIRQGCVSSMTELIHAQAKELGKDIDGIRRTHDQIWKHHNSLAREVSGFSGKIEEAVKNLKVAVCEIKKANNGGRRG